jgi:hypothetical protein
MSLDLALVLVLLAAAVGMFVVNKPRMDAAALIMIAALPLTGVITMEEAVGGFSDPNVVRIAVVGHPADNHRGHPGDRALVQ